MFCTKPLPEPMLTCEMDPKEHNSVNIQIKIHSFNLSKCILKRCLQNADILSEGRRVIYF